MNTGGVSTGGLPHGFGYPTRANQQLVSFSGKGETQTQNNPEAQKQTLPKKKPIRYFFAGNSLAKAIKTSFPKEMIPGKLTGYLILSLFLLSLVWGLVQFPLGKMLSGNTDIAISVGYPWPFFVMELLDPTASPLIISGLLLDLLLYVIISYMIEVAFNFLMSSSLMKSRKERSVMPKLFKRPRRKKEKERDVVGAYQRNKTTTQNGMVQNPPMPQQTQTRPVVDPRTVTYKSV